MIAEILSVGTELLMGQIANTDAQYLSRRLSELGIGVYRHTVVGDNRARLTAALAEGLSRADLVITTGGLGPTEDDLTKETVADYFNLSLVRDEASERAMIAYLDRSGRPRTKNNLKQAFFPAGATILPNACGTAPGCIVERDGKAVAILPGPPFEMKDMFERRLAPWLRARSGLHLVSRFERLFGIGESLVAEQLSDLFDSDNPTLALYCSPSEVEARITASAKDEAEALKRIEPVSLEIRARMRNHWYGEGRDCTLAQVVLDRLIARHQTVAFAESCTGGRMASTLIDCAGASAAIRESYITYSDEAKMKLLGVPAETLRAHTAVSAECARAMAEGARRASGADWTVSATGYAGPDGGTDAHPVGTVFLGLAGPNGAIVHEHHFAGSRDMVRLLAVKHGLNLLRRALLGLPDAVPAAGGPL